MFLIAEIRTVRGESLGVLILSPKVFRSGKEGFHGVGKLKRDGQRYQCQAQMVAIPAKVKQPE